MKRWQKLLFRVLVFVLLACLFALANYNEFLELYPSGWFSY